MTVSAAGAAPLSDAAAIAQQFVRARLQASPLSGYPGTIPAGLAGAYAVQEVAIQLWPDVVAGWKVGRIAPELHRSVGAERLAGPIFARQVWRAGDAPTAFPVFVGGFAAVEAEFAYRIGQDAPADKLDWTPDEALEMADALLIAVETAGSPLGAINQLGPLVVVSDFGNNAGLILGPETPNWRERRDEALVCEAFIDGRRVGRGSAASLPGGPATALAFLLGHCARQGRPLKRGTLVSTGAATGIHDIRAGQTARISFGDLGEIVCIAEPARPHERTGGNDGGHNE